MPFTEYFAPTDLDSPATGDDIAHVGDELHTAVPDDLAAFWRTSATFNGRVLTANGAPGAYLRILHPSSTITATRGSKAATSTPGILIFGRGEDWDYGVVAGSPTRWVDVDRDSGEVLSELGSTFVGFLTALRKEFDAEDDLLG